jgi:hypothetical protein
MADAYPWGSQSPAKRVSALESNIQANDRKRAAAIESHKARIAEIDEADRQFRSDLKAANVIVDRERREATSAAAAKVLDRIIGSANSDVDIDDAIRSGEFEKLVMKAIADAAAAKAKPKGKAKPDADPAEATPPAGSQDGESGTGQG